ncbi:hypothetical protein [Corynebacterium glyciniphilum]|uniref:hypothetical protein n=1 Tax=Corynebacterium glyciniphilum TaxID=1404244 RepID=UPI00264A52DF|nr:hypothetical protein [Corynebacterium glyciniphilum]MDN6706378.1 hypothetical protein [Corynebacterium glyciniphilum]
MTIPNAERVALGYLRDALDVPVFQIPPPSPPKRYVRLSRVGGGARNRVTDTAMLSISAYADDPGDAADLANAVREAMLAARGSRIAGTWCRWWTEATGPAFYPDPDREDRYRYQFSGELRLAIR